jgi:hypothetical protein
MPDAQCTRSRACSVESTRVSHHEFTGIIRHSRTRMVLTVSFVLSPVIGLSCHRRQRSCLHRLDAGVEASGPHDFAVRERLPQKPLGGVGTVPPKFLRRRISGARLAPPPRPPHPVPTSVTIAKRPSSGTGWRAASHRLPLEEKQNIFAAGDWTAQITLKGFSKSRFT